MAVVVVSAVLTLGGVLPMTSLAAIAGVVAGLAVLDWAAGTVHLPARPRWRRRAPVSPEFDSELSPELNADEGFFVVELDLRDSMVAGRSDEVSAAPPSGAGPGDIRRERLAEPVRESLQSAYALGDWYDWCRAPLDSAHPNFFVRTDRGEYVLQVSHARTSAAAVAYEVRLLEHLADAGYPSPRVVPTRAGDPWHLDGGLYVVTERLSGHGYDAGNPAHLAEAGRALAGYHRAVSTFSDRLRTSSRPVVAGLEKNGPFVLGAFADAAGPLLDDEARARLSRSSSYLWSQFIRVPEVVVGVLADCPKLVVHGSFGPDALRFDGDRLVGVSGFSRATYDLRALDVADALCGFAPAGAGFDLSRCAAFLAAYAAEAGLTDLECASIPVLVRMQRLMNVLVATEAFVASPLVLVPSELGLAPLVDLVEAEAFRLRWVDEHEPEFLEAVGSSRVP
jgi:homoserine kinase type II